MKYRDKTKDIAGYITTDTCSMVITSNHIAGRQMEYLKKYNVLTMKVFVRYRTGIPQVKTGHIQQGQGV